MRVFWLVFSNLVSRYNNLPFGRLERGDFMALTVFGKKLFFSSHAVQRFDDRGTSPEEVKRALEEGAWTPAQSGRQETKAVFFFGREWKGQKYETKTVNPVFIVEAETITVITIYVFYGGKVVGQ
jgi:hypothetical protein